MNEMNALNIPLRGKRDVYFYIRKHILDQNHIDMCKAVGWHKYSVYSSINLYNLYYLVDYTYGPGIRGTHVFSLVRVHSSSRMR